MVPYLKGIHLTLDSWRPWRKGDGWKMNLQKIRAAMEDAQKDYGHEGDDAFLKAPSQVKIVLRLHADVKALCTLFDSEEPPKRPVRPGKHLVAFYGFRDASGSGFGSTLVINSEIVFRHGQWVEEIEKESLNYRELTNLVFAIEEAYAAGLLSDWELFMCTDNTATKASFYKGTSSSQKLFNLILRLWKIQMQGGGSPSCHSHRRHLDDFSRD